MKNEDEIDPSLLVAATGMTPDQFASKTAVLGGFEAPEEDDMPGVMVMRGDYDTVRNALARENEDLAKMTDANRTIADAMVAIAHGARIFARQRSLTPAEFKIEVASATDYVLIFKAERAA